MQRRAICPKPAGRLAQVRLPAQRDLLRRGEFPVRIVYLVVQPDEPHLEVVFIYFQMPQGISIRGSVGRSGCPSDLAFSSFKLQYLGYLWADFVQLWICCPQRFPLQKTSVGCKPQNHSRGSQGPLTDECHILHCPKIAKMLKSVGEDHTADPK